VGATIVVVERNKYFKACVCVSVAFGFQREMRMQYICHPWLPGSKTFSHYHINDTIFGKKKVMGYKMCVQSFSTTFV
jgi:hypothetical protein